MNGHNKYLEVGVFVVAGIGLLIMLTLMFAGDRSNESKVRYSLLFQRDISGLTMGAPVKYLGVEVGQVVDMSLITDNGTSVKVDLELLESTPINSRTFASLSFQGVTGVAFVSLAFDESIPLTAISKRDGFDYPIIPTRDTGLAALLADGPEITVRLTQFLDRANLVLNDENIASLSNTLTNMDSLTENIDSLTTSLSAQENTISEIPQQLKGILDQVDSTVKQLRSTLNKAEPDFVSAMDTLNQATSSLERITTRLDKWAVEHEGDIDKFMAGGLAQTPALISDTRLAVRELEKFLSEFRKNPSQLIYQPNSQPVVVEP